MKPERLSVDQWVNAEKARLTVFARHNRIMGNLSQNTAVKWRDVFRRHCIRANQFEPKETK